MCVPPPHPEPLPISLPHSTSGCPASCIGLALIIYFTFVDIHESESRSVVSDLCDPMDYTVHGILQARVLEWVAFPFSRGSSQLRDWTQVSCIAGRFFTAEPQGKPKNIGVGSLSLLQGIFLTQESNQGLLHCGWILYQLSHQGNLVIYMFQCCSLKSSYPCLLPLSPKICSLHLCLLCCPVCRIIGTIFLNSIYIH